MSAEPTKAENQPAGDAPAAAPAEAAPQPTENAAAGADAPEEAKPAADTAATAQETGAKEEPKESKTDSKTEPKAEQPKEEPPKEEAAKETPLTKLAGRLADIKKEGGHDEMWGVTLSSLDHAPTAVVLQKFLRANDGDVALAEKQLVNALQWRKKTNPAALIDEKVFDREKFGDLGFVTEHTNANGQGAVITWNVYGAVKNNKATFGDLKE